MDNGLGKLFFPNPAVDWVNLQFSEPSDEPVIIELVDPAGGYLKRETAQPGNAAFAVPLPGLPPGLYSLRIFKGREVIIKKVVIDPSF